MTTEKGRQLDDEPGFDSFVAEHADALLRYGYVLTGNPHDAADLVQEALLRLRGAWPRVRRKDSPQSYARTTMARLHISVWRRRRREHLTGEPPDQAGHEVFPSDGEQGLWEELSALPRRQRAVLVPRYYEQLTDAEIAKVLGISSGTVRSQASRGLDKLRSSLSPSPATHGSTR
ncbi:SigE family RNA polymerase sigma factor [Streptosporangium sp. NBC_01639]|uniref:SigE family RNA polymerase sigma factor n=1 Tax=Streptosporangium sp. NBC_01639 TaxID=2975948 RepID=UPI00386647DC|nr:SigE family RNA polymerase sigma factor [Streptosporangium sp. NBC_01639]